ncbi:MAG: efflux RND transporter permease subunit, partial [Burkholderiales bacterium]
MNVSAWSIRNPVPGVVLFVLLSFAGLLSFNSMKVQNFPDLDLPTIVITASLPGASPAQMETEVARKIENAVVSAQGLKNIYTKVQDGSVLITCEFRIEKPIQEALDEIRSAVNLARSDLPNDLLEPIVKKLDFTGGPVLAFTISSPLFDEEGLSWFVDQTVVRRLLSIKGVGAVNRVGGVQRQVEIALDPVRMQALQISAA